MNVHACWTPPRVQKEYSEVRKTWESATGFDSSCLHTVQLRSFISLASAILRIKWVECGRTMNQSPWRSPRSSSHFFATLPITSNATLLG